MTKTYKIEQRTVESAELVDCFCNKCGSSLRTHMGYEGLYASGCGGFNSKIGDMVKWEFDMCETCLLELFKTFVHSPYPTEDEDPEGISNG